MTLGSSSKSLKTSWNVVYNWNNANKAVCNGEVLHIRHTQYNAYAVDAPETLRDVDTTS